MFPLLNLTVAFSVFFIAERPEFVVPFLALFFYREYREGRSY